MKMGQEVCVDRGWVNTDLREADGQPSAKVEQKLLSACRDQRRWSKALYFGKNRSRPKQSHRQLRGGVGAVEKLVEHRHKLIFLN
jgi:hypothetical protein